MCCLRHLLVTTCQVHLSIAPTEFDSYQLRGFRTRFLLQAKSSDIVSMLRGLRSTFVANKQNLDMEEEDSKERKTMENTGTERDSKTIHQIKPRWSQSYPVKMFATLKLLALLWQEAKGSFNKLKMNLEHEIKYTGLCLRWWLVTCSSHYIEAKLAKQFSGPPWKFID